MTFDLDLKNYFPISYGFIFDCNSKIAAHFYIFLPWLYKYDKSEHFDLNCWWHCAGYDIVLL